MPIEHLPYRDTNWRRISRRDARKLVLKQLARSPQEADMILDSLEAGCYTVPLGLGTRGQLRKKPRKKRRAKEAQ